jgi:acetyl esterase
LFTAEHMKHYACRLAVENNCVVVSSFYQSPPEVRAPVYHLQSYYALKYIIQNADKYSIDKTRICIQGESSGGMLTVAVAMELAKNNESNLIKYAVADVPACSFEWFRKERKDLSEIGQAVQEGHCDTFQFVAQDPKVSLDPANPDPNVFPAEMSDDLMAKLAPMYITTREFDQYRLDSEYIAKRLEKHGKLRELVIIPGNCHFYRNKKCWDMFKTIHGANL